MKNTHTTDRVAILDTTLRDGEQAPGFSLSVEEKLRMAGAIARLEVDAIEAGFPASSEEDFEAVRRIAEQLERSGSRVVPCALARCNDADIDRAISALSSSSCGRIHVFLATSDLHLEAKLRIGRSEALRRIRRGVERARASGNAVEFSPEDASRTDPDFLVEAVLTAVDAGASVVNVPDTVGYATPREMATTIARLRAALPDPEAVILSVHCHDDLGLAVANSLAAVEAGARQVECTVNGIGERAGNAALEEVVMALRTRGDAYRVETGVHVEAISDASKILTSLTGIGPAPNKAIVGANAFAHEAGIHQHGVLADPRTYEIMRPEDVGRRAQELVLGRHSGRHAVERRLSQLGFVLADAEFAAVFEGFKELATRRKQVVDDDLLALVAEQGRAMDRRTRLARIHVVSGTEVTPTATVRVEVDGHERVGVAIGDGPVDAAFRAVEQAFGRSATLSTYVVTAASAGKDAQGSVVVEVERGAVTAAGRGISTDTVEAAARAYLDALVKLESCADANAEKHATPAEEVAS